MTTVTIPKEAVGKKDLVAIPRDFYEAFLRWRGGVEGVKTFTPTARDKRVLLRARKNRKAGQYITLAELDRELR